MEQKEREQVWWFVTCAGSVGYCWARAGWCWPVGSAEDGPCGRTLLCLGGSLRAQMGLLQLEIEFAKTENGP